MAVERRSAPVFCFYATGAWHDITIVFEVSDPFVDGCQIPPRLIAIKASCGRTERLLERLGGPSSGCQQFCDRIRAYLVAGRPLVWVPMTSVLDALHEAAARKRRERARARSLDGTHRLERIISERAPGAFLTAHLLAKAKKKRAPCRG